uniref:Uncharacterized protein n=1 Tax=Oryza brachyantha TaxID=4533 RepID=J3NEN3_ORYBR
MDDWGRRPFSCVRATTYVEGIAFLHGKLYVLTSQEGLHILELDGTGFRRRIADDPEKTTYVHVAGELNLGHKIVRYLVESGGRLLMAVDSLRGRALFIDGAGAARSVLATSQHGAGARQDCIYFMVAAFGGYHGDSGVYDMRTGDISPLLLPERVQRDMPDLQRLHGLYPTWFFPAD